jgi:signal transduction histidine kinase
MGEGLVATLVILFAAIAAGAWPVVRRLTLRLEKLKRGVEQFGAGQLGTRIVIDGKDEVALVAQSFNAAAARIEELIRANKSLLANASHELRSPLARLKMALSMLPDADAAHLAALQDEIHRDIAELDSLVEEVLLASRLDVNTRLETSPTDALSVAAEEASRVDVPVDVDTPQAASWVVQADERLLRRALRNLLENAKRYGLPPQNAATSPAGEDESPVELRLSQRDGLLTFLVCDRGPGVPESERERIFDPFYRLPGHAEHAGGVGLGLSLVRQIAQRHHGRVRCLPREGGGSCFELTVPVQSG